MGLICFYEIDTHPASLFSPLLAGGLDVAMDDDG